MYNQNRIQWFYKIIQNFLITLKVKFHKSTSILGIFLLFAIILQCLSGIMLSFSLVSEPMLIPSSRSDEDMYDLYVEDFFWMHERGVDLIFMLTFFHFLRKLYLMSFSKDQESAWKSGSFLFLIIHGTIFFGLVLCCTHLSDITLTIAANIMQTFTLKTGKVYWILFTDQTLNVDTVLRAMYIHYILGIFLIYGGYLHAMEMHYDHKDFTTFDGVEITLNWFDLVLKNELLSFLEFLLAIMIFGFLLYSEYEPLNFELFMWGDVGFITDVRFFGVAPHWYFRAYMAWLLLCPQHYLGVFGLILLMVGIYFQPNLKADFLILKKKNKIITFNYDSSLLHFMLVMTFFLCVFYADSFLPYGRFFNRLGGNIGLTFSYLFIFFYLIVPINYIFSKILIKSNSII